MEKNELLLLIRENLEDGRLSCAAAFRLAAAHGLPLREIGQACNEAKIKISACQLGCF
ncbi:MAG: hypothetical protein DDT21_00531 [Syntrophomonadaceae bacterium]|nr:hypothetical protein [Bacillota bacterium]